jgi:hypothetical protein
MEVDTISKLKKKQTFCWRKRRLTKENNNNKNMSELNDYNYINVNETIIPVNTIKYKSIRG